MRRFIALLAAGLLTAACGGGGNKARPGKSTAVAAPQAKLSALVIEPETPTTATGVRALPQFDRKPAVPQPLEYAWTVNGRRVKDVSKAVLPRGKYRRGDKLQCRVRSKSGGSSIESSPVAVANAPPRFRPKPVAPFDIPGEFFHQVFAADPDGDTVTYRLVSPLARGVDLDGKTGVIHWRIDAVPEAPAPPPNTARPAAEEGRAVAVPMPAVPAEIPEQDENPFVVRLVIEADDGHGGVARHVLVLDLRRGVEQVAID